MKKKKKLSKKKMGKIALLFLQDQLIREGINLSKNTVKEIRETTKRLGISEEDAELFLRAMIKEAMKLIFPKKD
ncbi:MAG: hypothetical protein WCW14_02755 [Candidatus Paceibacterota bacterium]